MNPLETHNYYLFDLPDFMELNFHQTTKLNFCSLHEKNYTSASTSLNSFCGIEKLELNLKDGNESHFLLRGLQDRNSKTLESNILTLLDITPSEPVSYFSLQRI